MMDSIREGVKKPWAKILIFAIVISFVGAGYFTSTLFSGDPFAAATVNGESISTQEFQQAYARTKQQYGEAFKQFVKTEEQKRDFQENVLQNLISRTVILQEANKLGMRISDAQITKTLHEMPALQSEGEYSVELLDRALINIGKSRAQFKQSLISDMLLGQFSSGLADTEFTLPSELADDYKLAGQLRTGRALPIKYSLFDAGITINDEEINQFYEENKEQYRVEEKVTVDYIELSIAGLEKGVEVSEQAITDYYNENIDQFQSAEKRRVSHILITSDDDSAALAKANSIKAKIDAGEDFVKLVKSDSADEFSAENNGDLGFIAKGDQEESFETAVLSLAKVGDVSAPVKTSFGYHIIKLTDLVQGETEPLEQVKAQITAVLQKQGAEEEFYAKSKILEEKSFEISDSLDEVSKLVGIDVKTSPSFSRNSGVAVFANPDVREAAFSENVVDAKMNSSLINVDDSHVLVLRNHSHQPSEISSLDKVKPRVVASLKISKAKKLAISYGDELLKKLKSGADVTEQIALKGLAWKDLDKVKRQSASLPYLQLQKFFKMSRPSESGPTLNSMQDSSEFVVLVLNSVEDGNIDEAEKTLVEQSKQRLTQFYGNADYGSLIEQQRNNAEVTRNLANINR